MALTGVSATPYLGTEHERSACLFAAWRPSALPEPHGLCADQTQGLSQALYVEVGELADFVQTNSRI